MRVWSLALCLCALLGLGRGARILVCVPTPSFSHQVVFRPLTQELARRGHQLVVLTTDPARAPHPNITEIDLHDSYALWNEGVVKKVDGKRDDQYTKIEESLNAVVKIFEKQMRSPEVAKLLGNSSERFDLVIVEAWLRPALALAHRFRAPVVFMAPSGVVNEFYEFMGLPGTSYLYIDFLRTRIYNVTLWEEAKDLYSRYRLHRLIIANEEKEQAMLSRVFGELPPVSELMHYVELLFVNEHPLWDALRPTPRGVVHLGCIHLTSPKELPHELKAWMDASRRGVIYVSFGTNTDPSLLPAERMAVFTRVLGSLPYDVLWRWRAPPPLPANVRAVDWLPQPDLLRHEKLVLFVMQAGTQSLEEALRAGVPMLAVPMLVDQWYNAELLVHYGAARQLDLYSLTDASLTDAIHELIHDKSYRENSRLLGEELRDRPQSSLQRAVWWTEHVLRRRGRGLRARGVPPATRLALPALAAAALAAAVAYVVLYCACKLLSKGTRKRKVA